MNPEELLKPRFEVIADYPSNTIEVGTVLVCPNYDNEFTKKYWVESKERYPHLFRKLNWWDKREESEMPKYLKHTMDGQTDFYEVVKWDMKIMFGFTDIKRREGCSILTWSPEYTYQPATEHEYLNSLRLIP